MLVEGRHHRGSQCFLAEAGLSRLANTFGDQPRDAGFDHSEVVENFRDGIDVRPLSGQSADRLGFVVGGNTHDGNAHAVKSS